MRQVDIFTEVMFSGNFKCGQAKYSIVLRMFVEGNEKTKVHIGELTEVSRQQAEVKVCVLALQCMKVPCEITIHINSLYVAFMYGKQREVRKNVEEWNAFWKEAAIHEVLIVNEASNEYSPAMRIELHKYRHHG